MKTFLRPVYTNYSIVTHTYTKSYTDYDTNTMYKLVKKFEEVGKNEIRYTNCIITIAKFNGKYFECFHKEEIKDPYEAESRFDEILVDNVN